MSKTNSVKAIKNLTSWYFGLASAAAITSVDCQEKGSDASDIKEAIRYQKRAAAQAKKIADACYRDFWDWEWGFRILRESHLSMAGELEKDLARTLKRARRKKMTKRAKKKAKHWSKRDVIQYFRDANGRRFRVTRKPGWKYAMDRHGNIYPSEETW